MTISIWQPGELIQPGDLRQPASAPSPVSTALLNPDFESGNTGWDLGTGWSILQNVNGPTAFSGTWQARASHTGTSYSQNQAVALVNPGQVITATARGAQSANADNNNLAWVALRWLDGSLNEISIVDGNKINETNAGTPWRTSTVVSAAPANAVYVALLIGQSRVSGTGTSSIDYCTWDHVYQPQATDVVYQAVQADPGYTASSEPTWPGLGNQVVDNQVTWEGVLANRVTWQAFPILKSSGTEPTWPTAPGAQVIDGSVIWTATTGRITDEKNPNTGIVAIGASKVFAADDDIIPYSATVNPLDWTTEEDAGYLPFGLQTYGANPVKALGLYRSNLVAFNAAAFQMWQIDQDPANMALLDAVPVGSTYRRAIAPVQNDLLFLSSLGIRNIGIAAGSTNLQAGSWGEVIDALVVEALADLDPDLEPIALFYPARGQYWLILGEQAFVLTLNPPIRAWSRYVFPEAITDWAIEGENLYLRTVNDKVWRLDEDAVYDDVGEEFGDDILLLLRTVGASGATFEDASDYQRELTLIGTPTVDSSLRAFPSFTDFNSIDIDVNDGFSVASLADYDFSTTDFSIDFWVQIPTSPTGGQKLVAKQGGTTLYPFAVELQSGASIRFLGNDGTGTSAFNLISQATLANNTWTHIMAGRAGSTFYLYVDGVAAYTSPTGNDNTFSGALATNAEPIRIAQDNLGAIDFVGTLQEVRIRAAAPPTANFTPPTAPYERTETDVDFTGVIHWPYVDGGRFGVDKMMEGFDIVGTGEVAVQVGYDQRNFAALTAPYTLEAADTFPGQPIPLPLQAPSFSLRLEFAAGQKWEWQAANIYIHDTRSTG